MHLQIMGGGGGQFSAIESKNKREKVETMPQRRCWTKPWNCDSKLSRGSRMRTSMVRNKYFHKDWGNQIYCLERSCLEFFILESFQIHINDADEVNKYKI